MTSFPGSGHISGRAVRAAATAASTAVSQLSIVRLVGGPIDGRTPRRCDHPIYCQCHGSSLRTARPATPRTGARRARPQTSGCLSPRVRHALRRCPGASALRGAR